MNNQENAYDLLRRGKELLESRNPAQAAVILERAKRIEPEKGSIREALAQAYFNYREYVSSMAEFEKSIEIDPTNHYAHFGLGLCLRKLGKAIEAGKHLKLALAMEPDSELYQKTLEELAGKS
jgi:tetratricopeptide (TPR) repeat protein